MRRPLGLTALGLTALGIVLLWSSAAAAKNDPIDPLYRRIATDLRAGKPLVITVYVALCSNNAIACGSKHPLDHFGQFRGGGRGYFPNQLSPDGDGEWICFVRVTELLAELFICPQFPGIEQ